MMHRLADSFEALSRDRIGGLVGVEEDRELRAQTGEKNERAQPLTAYAQALAFQVGGSIPCGSCAESQSLWLPW